jgi:hypothetical protein
MYNAMKACFIRIEPLIEQYIEEQLTQDFYSSEDQSYTTDWNIIKDESNVLP